MLAGRIANATDNILEYTISTTDGNSGSQIYMDDYYAIGVNTREYTARQMNFGSRVNDFLFNTAKDIVNNN